MTPYLLWLYGLSALAKVTFSICLERRQIRHVAAHRDCVPAALEGQISLEAHQKAADYETATSRLSIVNALLRLPVELPFLVWGVNAVAGWTDKVIPQQPILAGLLLFGALFACDMPFSIASSYYKTFRIDGRFGLNRRSRSLFVADTVKETIIQLIVAGAVVSGVIWAASSLHGFWWLYVWAGLTVLALAGPAIYLNIIGPMFNRYTPVTDDAVIGPMQDLFETCGMDLKGVQKIDASKRSTVSNAFLIGFGRRRRIILYDTLLASLNPAQIAAVIAHELGHLKHRHIILKMAEALAKMFVALAAIGWLSHQPWLPAAFGFHSHTIAVALLAAMLLTTIVSPVTSAVSNALSRHHEFQADAFAVAACGAGPLRTGLVKLTTEAARTFTPDPLYARVRFDHPPLLERLSRLR